MWGSYLRESDTRRFRFAGSSAIMPLPRIFDQCYTGRLDLFEQSIFLLYKNYQTWALYLHGFFFILRLRPCRWPLWQSQASWLLARWLGVILIALLACWALLSDFFCFDGTIRFDCVLARWLQYAEILNMLFATGSHVHCAQLCHLTCLVPLLCVRVYPVTILGWSWGDPWTLWSTRKEPVKSRLRFYRFFGWFKDKISKVFFDIFD